MILRNKTKLSHWRCSNSEQAVLRTQGSNNDPLRICVGPVSNTISSTEESTIAPWLLSQHERCNCDHLFVESGAEVSLIPGPFLGSRIPSLLSFLRYLGFIELCECLCACPN